MARKRKRKSGRSKSRTKVVVRRLPPEVTEEDILSAIVDYKDHIDWHRFVTASHRYKITLGHGSNSMTRSVCRLLGSGAVSM